MLNVVTLSSTQAPQTWDMLQPHGVNVVERFRPLPERLTLDHTARIDAALLDLEGFDADQRATLIATCKDQGVAAVVVTTGGSNPAPVQSLDEGADAVVPRESGPAEVACALWSASRQAAACRQLRRRVETLEQKLESRRLIEQAKSIIAEVLRISEADALRHLRKEARDRRRPMQELARIVIVARQIMPPADEDNGTETEPSKEAAAPRSGAHRPSTTP